LDGDRYFFEIQAALGKANAEAVTNAQPPSLNGTAGKRFEY
jgi:hypothetical protein